MAAGDKVRPVHDRSSCTGYSAVPRSFTRLSPAPLPPPQVLCFSQSMHTLDFLEMVLGTHAWGPAVGVKCEVPGLLFSKWTNGQQFLKITGKQNAEERQKLIHRFNDKTR